MPKSHHRKRKKHLKKVKSRTESPDYEMIDRDGLQMIREGKNILIKNTRTPEDKLISLIN